jgi:hypothetical protein
MRRKLDIVQNGECGSEHCIPDVDSFMNVLRFDTSLEPCLRDPNMALSYQTGIADLLPGCYSSISPSEIYKLCIAIVDLLRTLISET